MRRSQDKFKILEKTVQSLSRTTGTFFLAWRYSGGTISYDLILSGTLELYLFAFRFEEEQSFSNLFEEYWYNSLLTAVISFV